MPAHRLRIPFGTPLGEGSFSLSGEEARHAATVKRLRVGEAVEVLDGRGLRAAGLLVGIGGSKREPVLEIEVSGVVREERAAVSVVIVSAVPKSDRLSRMVDQLAQIGVSRWVPMETERSEGKAGDVKRGKLERVIEEAGKQSGRSHDLEIGEPARFDEMVNGGGILCDGSGAVTVSAATRGVIAGNAEVTLFVGPEGGWSDGEREMARTCGVAFARLGPHVLRLETAAVAAAAVAMDVFGESGERDR